MCPLHLFFFKSVLGLKHIKQPFSSRLQPVPLSCQGVPEEDADAPSLEPPELASPAIWEYARLEKTESALHLFCFAKILSSVQTTK